MVKILNAVKKIALVEEIFNEVKPCIEKNLQKNNEILDIVTEIRDFQSNNPTNELAINERTLNEIYDLFIKPYIECEVHDIGTIMDVIRLNNIIDNQLKLVENEQTRLILKILRDVMTVVINARNEKMEVIQYKKRLADLNEKYRKCNIEIIKLRNRIEDLVGDTDVKNLTFKGSLGMQLKKIKPFIYFQARLDIDKAWYAYLYPNCPIDPKKYQSTIAYVRSFGTLQNAYNTLIKLLDEHFALIEDDLTNNKIN